MKRLTRTRHIIQNIFLNYSLKLQLVIAIGFLPLFNGQNQQCWSCENYGCRENCCEDSEIENCKNRNSTYIFDMPLLLTYFVFAQQKRLQKFRDPEMGHLIIETHHATDTWEADFSYFSYFMHRLKRRLQESCKSS